MPNSYFNRITNAFGKSRRKDKKESPRNVSNNYSNSSEHVTQNTSDTLTADDYTRIVKAINEKRTALELLEATSSGSQHDIDEIKNTKAELDALLSETKIQNVKNVSLGGKKNMSKKSKKQRRTKRAFKVHSSKKYRRARK
jgi:hypothetical protein